MPGRHLGSAVWSLWGEVDAKGKALSIEMCPEALEVHMQWISVQILVIVERCQGHGCYGRTSRRFLSFWSEAVEAALSAQARKLVSSFPGHLVQTTTQMMRRRITLGEHIRPGLMLAMLGEARMTVGLSGVRSNAKTL